MKNESGLYPCGRFVLVKPDEIEEKTESGVIVFARESDRERHSWGTSTGIMIAAGPDAWTHGTQKHYEIMEDGRRRLVSVTVDGFGDAFAKPGDRVAFAPQGGRSQRGKDGVMYRLVNDTDILEIADEEVNFMSIPDPRKPIGLKGAK